MNFAHLPTAALGRCVRRIVAPLLCAVTLATQAYGADDSVGATAGKVARATPAGSIPAPVYPLKVSANRRHLVDQNETPFLLTGDSPQALIGKLSEADAAAYMANRVGYGINALWISLLCNKLLTCRDNGDTFDGIAPFTTPEDLSTPNPAYFQRAAAILKLAADMHIAVLLNPIETAGWLRVLRANGVDKAFRYGRYLGERFRQFDNIIWFHGNDFQTWKDPHDDAVVQAVARGIAAVDQRHLQTVELNYMASGSLDDPSFAPLVQISSAYTYYPTYAQVLKEYNRPNYRPVLMVEANYEFEHNSGTDGGATQNLRRQEYWTMLSGAAGQLYGSAYTWPFPSDWRSHLDTPGIAQFKFMKDLLAPRRWYDLVPDQRHAVVTAGYGRFSAAGSVTKNTYVTAARTPDGKLAMAYLPTMRVVTVDMSGFAGPVAVQWYDPTIGKFVEASGSAQINRGYRSFSPPGLNGDGGGDWILMIATTE